MATEKQGAANRLNARKSTGPRTSEGKARAARNSLKHGLLAKLALLPDEDADEFLEFAGERLRELNPHGPRENDLAALIVSQLWRLNRCARVEAGLFTGDRANRDHKYFWDQMMRYRRSGLDRALEVLAGHEDEVKITDEKSHAEAVESLSGALEAQRTEPALLGYAFSSAAANGDPFSKLGRYETTALNRVRRLQADFDELQARRKSLHHDDGSHRHHDRCIASEPG